MKIYLFLTNRILTFILPQTVFGSYSFDEDPKEESKLINIEARDNQWVIYSTADSSILLGGTPSLETLLKVNEYYVLRKNNQNYLIYVTEIFDNSFNTYIYTNKLSFIIGNTRECNINFQNGLITDRAVSIEYNQNQIILQKTKNINIYVNNVSILGNQYAIKIGDQLNIYGLRIIFLNGIIIMNNPTNIVRINLSTTGLSQKSLSLHDVPVDEPVKDIELYDKKEYFSKSPRLRRTITTKEIKLSPPPKQNGENEMPMILTIGPMLTMGLVSVIMLVNTLSKISSGETTFAKSWSTVATSSAMVISMLFWPTVTRMFNTRIKAKKKHELIVKYTKYLEEKKHELADEMDLQKSILNENLLTVEECLQIIQAARLKFWDKRVEQSDFLEFRLGKGRQLLDVKVNYPEEGFSVDEDELRKQADAMVEEYRYINDVPVGYSLYKNKITGVMGTQYKCSTLINNIILQLITFYSYEDVKLVVFTNKSNEERWDYIKYLNHNFTNDKSMRFFATDYDSTKNLGDYLNMEIQNRLPMLNNRETPIFQPYYVVIVDDYASVKRHNFLKLLTEADDNLGFSLVIMEESLSKLPSKCNNFIVMGDTTSGVLTNSFEKQVQETFRDELNYSVDMMEIAKKLSNIPIEFQNGGSKQLPEAITFLEMEKVGKVEQLNILNRWRTNDSTTSLKAEVGVDDDGNLMYLDLHEKYHGPHGLIAGMTGSGKSEFIITYILSMAINYSPDDVAFILIDYKGGGLAFAFENKATGVSLPHLAGTITNLDKAEMNRTLVSIDSEIHRRQTLFNEARDKLGESTIDIYKYQRHFKEGRITEPIPHLFIICDEFAELKSQQPDFMDNLITVARIGRSLGIHLILATQKPSGVVNDQIWSNTKFRVCLKVQDASDSKEMLKRPDAASLKQTGRFYLQVGYDEYFALGQSAWCGAKYYPSEKIVKQIDKSINFINDTGNFIKNIQDGNKITIEPQGEQLSAIMKNIIEVSEITHQKVKRLWLNDIDHIILVNNLLQKYRIQPIAYQVAAIIGEYDAPEKQEQGLLTYQFQEGNAVIYGNDEAERESLLNSIIYSTCINHTASEVNIYAIDYGSETLRMFHRFPQVGGLVFMGEDEKFKNLLKLITEEIKNRKKLLIPYGGSFENYNNKNTTKLPYILFILNNYDGIVENYRDIYEPVSTISRECERYGINLMITCNVPSSIGRRINQFFRVTYALHLTDPSDYYSAFNMKCPTKPRDIPGRGLAYIDGIHEFQTASIVTPDLNISDYVNEVAIKVEEASPIKAKPIPSLPDVVTFDSIASEISSITKVPIGISKESLKVVKHDFTSNTTTPIISNRLENLGSFVDSLLDVFTKIPNLAVIFIDTLNLLPSAGTKNIKYYNNNFDNVLKEMATFTEQLHNNNAYNIIYVIYGIEKLKSKLENTSNLEELIKQVKANDHSNIILCDGAKNFKAIDFESWYSSIKNNTDGIWIGKGFGEQSNLRVGRLTKEMTLKYPQNYGFYVSESSAELMKVIEFNNLLNNKEGDEEDE